MRFLLLFLFLLIGANVFPQEPLVVLDSGGHKARVNQVLFTPDEKFLVSCSDDKTIKVWDVQSGRCVRTIRGFTGPGYEGMVYAIALSPDGCVLAAGGWFSNDGVRLYDFKSGRMTGTLYGNSNAVHSLAFSPDGKCLVSGAHDGRVLVWEKSASGFMLREALHYHEKAVYGISISPDDRWLASSSHDRSLAVYDLRMRRLLRQVTNVSEREVYHVRFSPDGRRLIASSYDGTVTLWELRPNFGFRQAQCDKRHLSNDLVPLGVLHSLGAGSNFTENLCYAPDGAGFYFGGKYFYKEKGSNVFPLFYMDFASGKAREFDRYDNSIRSIAVSVSGRLVASTGGNDNRIVIRPADGHGPARVIESEGKSMTSVAFGKDGKSLGFGFVEDGCTYMANCSLERALFFLPVLRVSNGPPAAMNRLYTFWNLPLEFNPAIQNRMIMVNYHPVYMPKNYDTIRCFTYTPDGKYFIIGSDFSLVRVTAGKGVISRVFTGHDGAVYGVAVSADGRFLLSCSADQTIKLWDVENGRLIMTFFVSVKGEWAAWTPEGYFSCSRDGARFLGFVWNRGPEQEPQYFPAGYGDYYRRYHRPDIVKSALPWPFPSRR